MDLCFIGGRYTKASRRHLVFERLNALVLVLRETTSDDDAGFVVSALRLFVGFG